MIPANDVTEEYGKRRERQVRDVAAKLGVADFVYSAPQVSKGNGNREPSGDGLLIVGGRGAILQVKTRSPAVAAHDSPTRGKSWIRKNALKARGQGIGARGELCRLAASGKPLKVLPVRAQRLPAEAQEKYARHVDLDVRSWPIIVLVEHPLADDEDLGFDPGVVWLTLDDWLSLHQRIRSTAGMLTYVERVLLGGVHVPLGHEVERYAAMHDADMSAAGHPSSLPALPPIDGLDDTGVDIYHDILDKLWPDDGSIPWRTADEYRRIVEFLDAVPAALQAVAGRWFLRKRAEIANGAPRSSGVLRLGNRDRIVYSCSNSHDWTADTWFREVLALTSLRHEEALSSGAPADTVTLGIGALVNSVLGTAVIYNFSYFEGHAALEPLPLELRQNLQWLYGRHHHEDGRTKEVRVGRNDQCPCMSGKKFKKCCGRTA